MSYTYLRDAGEESSAECFSDIHQSVPWKSNHTREKSYCNVSATESCHASQSGMMSQPSMANRGKESLTSCVAASRARTSASPEHEKDWMEKEAVYGMKCGEWFAKYVPDSCSWKTRQPSLIADLAESWLIWPKWGMMHNGECFMLPMLELHICGEESSFWPTPEASLNIAPYSPKTARNWGGKRKSGAKIGSSLRWWPEFLPEADAGGKWVNPDLCEIMMDWPQRWTDCTPLEMDKFRLWLNWHGKP